MPSADPLLIGEKRKISSLRKALLGWAETEGRAFPWRDQAAGNYERIVVEVLLQRTTAIAVARSYREFFTRFPDWETLAHAKLEDLEGSLKPLGLWRRRALSLLGLARYATSVAGKFPRDPIEHGKIPAVGQYVSNAIMLFQHGQSSPLLDVNMTRVIERVVRPRRLSDIRHDPWLQEASHWYARGKSPELANWAALDFAATICKAKAPKCGLCLLRNKCNYYNKSKYDRIFQENPQDRKKP